MFDHICKYADTRKLVSQMPIKDILLCLCVSGFDVSDRIEQAPTNGLEPDCCFPLGPLFECSRRRGRPRSSRTTICRLRRLVRPLEQVAFAMFPGFPHDLQAGQKAITVAHSTRLILQSIASPSAAYRRPTGQRRCLRSTRTMPFRGRHDRESESFPGDS